MVGILLLLFLFSFLLTAITTLPFVLVVLLLLTILFKKSWIFVLAFFAGLFLDILLMRLLGESSVFFLIFIFIIFLYDRKFEIQSVPFVFLSSFLGVLLYLLIFDNNYVFGQALVSSVVSVLLFKLLSRRFLYST